MESLQLSNAKLLYVVSELKQQGTITDEERATIKEKIVNEDPRVVDLLNQYEKSGNESVLRDGILDILRPKVENIEGLGLVVGKSDGPAQDEATSPLGNQLFERKKKHQTGNELQGLIKTIKPII